MSTTVGQVERGRRILAPRLRSQPLVPIARLWARCGVVPEVSKLERWSEAQLNGQSLADDSIRPC
ncbi:MAG: hypothetical protein M3P18_12720 [Actinomycetota bacterium]|nr:hypothetical protein [Actinomycetota bacterium]